MGVIDPFLPTPMTVTKVVRETEDTVTFTLAAPGFKYLPGQFNMVWLFGHGEVPVSISGDPAEPDVLVHTIRGVGSVTQPMIRVEKGASLGVRGPYGTSWPVEAAKGKDVVFVAGGLGLAPLKPAIHAVLGARSEYGRVAIFIGARSPDQLVFLKEIERWRGRLDVDVQVTVDRASTEWRGDVGLITPLLPRVPVDWKNAHAFVCGPEIMMRFLGRDLEKLGVAPSRIAVSLERNMKCAVGFCGHCQLGPDFICKDGPVFPLDRIAPRLVVKEL